MVGPRTGLFWSLVLAGDWENLARAALSPRPPLLDILPTSTTQPSYRLISG